MARYFFLILIICIVYTGGEKPRKNQGAGPGQGSGEGPGEGPDIGVSQTICGSSASSELAADLNDAYANATEWVLSQRTADWGWPLMSTATSILSLQLNNASWYGRGTDDLTAQLSVKQLEIELLAHLSQATADKGPDNNPRMNTTNEMRMMNTSDGDMRMMMPDISPGALAYYIMALNSTCHDVTDFYGHNLVRMLKHHMDQFPRGGFNNYFQYALGLLALCQSGAPIKPEYIQQVMEGQSADGAFRFGSDVASMTLMAMACIEDKVPEQHRKGFSQLIKRSANFVLLNQNGHGTFDNPISTALAAQALLSTETSYGKWNCEAAVRSILDEQTMKGEINSLGGTLQILPLLAGKTFANIKNVMPQCDVASEEEEPEGEIQITLIVENGVDTSMESLSLNVTVPVNATLYEAMVVAMAEYSDTFRFVSPVTQFGHSVEEINGVANDNDNYYYWIILIGIGRKSALKGVDGIITEDGETYILYYQSFA